jgi:hypothetical protein
MRSTFRLSNRRLVVWVACGLAAWSSSRSQVQAQHTPDPYNIVGEFNRQYEPYVFSTGPNDSGVFANQARLEERNAPRGPNRYQQYLDDLDGGNGADAIALPGRARGGGGAMSDSQAARAAELARNRMYRPNAKTDKDFYSGQRERDLRYFEALGQTDPVKRAQMLREFRASDSRSARSASGKAKAPRETRRLDTDDSRFSDAAGAGTDEMTDTDLPPPPTGSSARRSSTAPLSRTRPRVGSLLDPGPPLDRSNSTESSPRSPLNPRSGSITGRSSTTNSPSAKPSDVLKRSRALDRDSRSSSSSGPIDPRTLDPPTR